MRATPRRWWAVTGAIAVLVAAFAPAPPAASDTNEGPPTFVRSWGIRGSGLPGAPQLADGSSVAVDGAGNVYVADDLERIQKFAPDGTRLDVLGGIGTGPGRFTYLGAVTVGANGNLYTLEPCGGAACADRVQQLSPSGTPVSSFPASASSVTTDLATDAAGNVYVASRVPRQVQKYGADGTLLQSWPLQATLADPQAITVDGSGLVYVGDDANDRVEVYTSTGEFVRMFGSPGSGNGQFVDVAAIDVDAAGHIFVLGRTRVQEFDATGAFVGAWGTSGSGNGQFTDAVDLARGPGGHLWVLDGGLDRVQDFDATHAFVRAWGAYGDGGPQFADPTGIARDGAGNLYVADTGNDRIQKTDASGTYLASWGTTGAADGQLNGPADVDVALGSVFVTDGLNNRVQRFSLTGDFLASFGSTGSGAAQLSGPRGIDVAGDGTVYVADSQNQRIQVFDATGAPLRRWAVDGAPVGVALDLAGNVLVVNEGHFVQRFSPTGSALGAWDLRGVGADTDAVAIEVDPAGNVWVADQNHRDAVKLRPDGTLLARVRLASPYTTAGVVLSDFAFGADRRVFVVSGGLTVGGQEGLCCVAPAVYELQGQTGPLVDVTLAVDQVTATVGDPLDVHLTIRNTGTVPLTGVTVSSTSVPECAGPVADLAPSTTRVVDCTHVTGAGDAGQFAAVATVSSTQGAQAPSNTVTLPVGRDAPPALAATFVLGSAGYAKKGIDTHPGGGFFVGETTNLGRVQQFSAAGAATSSFGTPQLDDVAVGPGGDLFVDVTAVPAQDQDDGAVRRYTTDGTHTATFLAPGLNGRYTGVDADDTGRVFVTEAPRSVCIDRDVLGHCNANGSRGTSQVVRFAADGLTSTSFGTPGAGDGQLAGPSDVAVSGDRVYVADTGNHRIATFTDSGAFVRNLPSSAPSSVATAPDGTLYAASSQQGLVQAYAPDGTLLSSWQTPALTTQRVATDAAGRVYVLDVLLSRLRVYEPVGRVAGSVTEAGTGDPVPGAWVAVLRTADFSIAGSAVADGGGGFSAQVPAGSYFAYAVDPTGAHTPGFFGAPTTVSVPAGGVGAANPVMGSTRGRVSGAVTEDGSGTPVAGASVVVMSASGEAQRVVAANGSGQFSVGGVSVGNHLLAYFDPSGGHRPEFFANAPDAFGATPVAVTAGGNAVAGGSLPVQVAAPGGAVLSGVVSEEGSGAPVAGAEVIVLRASDFGFVRSGRTDGSGAYSLSVPQEAYKLAFIDSSGARSMEWHADQPFHGLGSAVSVVAPAVTDAALGVATGRVSGSVTAAGSGAPIGGAWVIAIGPSGIAGGAVSGADGSYSVSGLAPGSYRMTFVDTVGGRPQEYWHDAADFSAATPVAVTAAHDTTGVSPVLG